MKKLILLLGSISTFAYAGGGPLGIDHKLSYDDSGIFKRRIQKDVLYLTVAGVVGGALWEGDQSRLGKIFWQSVDSTIVSSASAEVLKATFTRARPTQTDNPNLFFQGSGHYSFPSGEVAAVSAAVTPFVLEYRKDEPWIYSLEALPLYDAIARMKVQAHWQTDVLAGFAIGTLSGFWAHSRSKSFMISILPGGFSVGLKKEF